MEFSFVNGFAADRARYSRCDDGYQQEREHNRIITRQARCLRRPGVSTGIDVGESTRLETWA